MLDKLQIMGFILSAVISLSLIILGQEAIGSASVGLILAVLTQLFDLQLRNNAAEERLLRAKRLNQELYRDQWLVERIQDIVEDYLAAKNSWFRLFGLHAEEAISACCQTLSTIADQNQTYADFKSPLAFGVMAFREAIDSIKMTVVVHSKYWRQGHSEQYLQENKNAIMRGVSVTRIFVQRKEVLADMLDVLGRQRGIGVNVRVGFLDENVIPEELINDCLIVDDRIATKLEVGMDGNPVREYITIDPTVVSQRVRAFELLVYYTKTLDEALKYLKGD